jgi:acyl-CoA synthetase (AMP-forming)/AMP-acid ligase II
VLAGHPSIEAVAAVGIPDERFGERLCVVVMGDPKLRLDSVVDFLRSRGVGTHTGPEALMVVDSFPRTDIGKIRRGELRLQAIEAMGRGELIVNPSLAAARHSPAYSPRRSRRDHMRATSVLPT